MSALNSLKLLISKLTEAEINLCRQYLKAFDSRGEAFSSKSIKLFDLLANHDSSKMTESEIEFFLYGKRNTVAYSRLLIRLKDKLLDALVLDANIKREGVYADRVQKRMSIRKKLNYADALFNRGLPDLAESSLHGTLEIAKEYELFDELLAALRLHERIALEQDKLQYVRKLSINILYVRQQISLIETALQLEVLTLIDKPEKIAHRLTELIPISKEAASHRSNFIIYGIQASVEKSKGNYSAAGTFLKEKLRSITPKAFTNPERRLAFVNSELAENAICLSKFGMAIKYASMATSLSLANHEMIMQMKETIFYAHFYSKRFQEARDVFNEFANEDEVKDYGYLKAAACFVLNEFDEAERLLDKLGKIELTIGKFGAWPMILRQMVLIEKGLKDDDTYLIRMLQKSRSGIKLPGDASQREFLADKLLSKLLFENFDFKAIHKSSPRELELLKQEEGGCQLTIWSPELIPFQDWFFSRLTKGPLGKLITTPRVSPHHSQRIM